MLKLNDSDGWKVLREARGEDPAVRGRFLPITRGVKRRARQRAIQCVAGADLAELDRLALSDLGDAYSYEVLRLTLVEWDGVGGKEGEPIEITPPLDERIRTSDDPERPIGTIDAFLAVEDIFEAADQAVVMPSVEADRAKNAFAASPNGTGEAETPAPTIAGSPARAEADEGAESVRTGSTSRKPSRKKVSGQS